MRLQSFHVRNVGRLSDVELSFSAGQASPPRSWTVLTGINGTGKTSLLQAMALGLSGPEVRKQFARPPGRGPAQHGVLRSELVDLEAQIDQVIELRLDPGEGKWIAHLASDRGSESADALVLAYGIHRSLCRLEEALPARGELELLAVGSLFGPRLPPLGPRFRKFFEEADEFGKGQRFAAALRAAVLASDGSGPLLEWVDGRRLGHRKSGLTSLQEDLDRELFALDIPGGGEPVPLEVLPQGCQSIIVLIADILGHAIAQNENIKSSEEVKAIVLIDEIDLHLHPQWQRRIVPILSSLFPLVQFIATTHSPLVLASCEGSSIFELELEREGVKVRPKSREFEPRKMEASEILHAYFGVDRAMDPKVIKDEREFLRLLAKGDGITETERQKKERLQSELAGIWGGELSPRHSGPEAQSRRKQWRRKPTAKPKGGRRAPRRKAD